MSQLWCDWKTIAHSPCRLFHCRWPLFHICRRKVAQMNSTRLAQDTSNKYILCVPFKRMSQIDCTQNNRLSLPIRMQCKQHCRQYLCFFMAAASFEISELCLLWWQPWRYAIPVANTLPLKEQTKCRNYNLGSTASEYCTYNRLYIFTESEMKYVVHDHDTNLWEMWWHIYSHS